MSQNTRYMATELETPVRSSLRRRKPAIIPPFTFVGELEVGLSGIWYPTSTTILTDLSVIASSAGTEPASFTLVKKEPTLFPDNVPPTPILNFTLGLDGKKSIYGLGNTVVTPNDKVYLASWVNSGHLSVVVQMVGVIMI